MRLWRTVRLPDRRDHRRLCRSGNSVWLGRNERFPSRFGPTNIPPKALDPAGTEDPTLEAVIEDPSSECRVAFLTHRRLDLAVLPPAKGKIKFVGVGNGGICGKRFVHSISRPFMDAVLKVIALRRRRRYQPARYSRLSRFARFSRFARCARKALYSSTPSGVREGCWLPVPDASHRANFRCARRHMKQIRLIRRCSGRVEIKRNDAFACRRHDGN
jgi:hypothetical protein